MKAQHLIPLGLFAVLAVVFAIGLNLKPKEIPSARLGKPVPVFDVQGFRGGKGLSSDDLAEGRFVVNVFASWCIPCRAEHPLLMKLAASGVAVYGLNYKDRDEDAMAFLDEMDNPYSKIGSDISGRVGIDWGVSGVPETFVVVDGMIVNQHIGPLTEAVIAKKITPFMEGAK